MTDLEIEKLAEAILRRMPQAKLTDELKDEIEDLLNDKLARTMKRMVTALGEALVNMTEDL